MLAWHLNPLVSLHWRCWDGEWVVFDVGSGLTHQMDTFTAVTLMMFEDAPAHLEKLASSVAQELLIPNNQALADTLQGVLDRLVASGLVGFTPP